MKSYRVNGNGDLIDENTGKLYLPLPSAVVQAKAGRREQVQEITESRADREQQQKPTVKTPTDQRRFSFLQRSQPWVPRRVRERRASRIVQHRSRRR